MSLEQLQIRVRESNLESSALLDSYITIATSSQDAEFVQLVRSYVEIKLFQETMSSEYHCLIAEDDEDVLSSMQTLLQLEGFNVDTARNMEELTIKLANKFYPALFVDINMPANDKNKNLVQAWSYLDSFRNTNTITSIYIISAEAQVFRNVMSHKNLDIVAHLQKPFTARMIIPYLKAEHLRLENIKKQFKQHPNFSINKWRSVMMANYCQARLNIAKGDFALAAKLCNITERSIRRIIKQNDTIVEGDFLPNLTFKKKSS